VIAGLATGIFVSNSILFAAAIWTLCFSRILWCGFGCSAMMATTAMQLPLMLWTIIDNAGGIAESELPKKYARTDILDSVYSSNKRFCYRRRQH
jgi:Na+/H+-translocating membrane pyrophosphatase